MKYKNKHEKSKPVDKKILKRRKVVRKVMRNQCSGTGLAKWKRK